MTRRRSPRTVLACLACGALSTNGSRCGPCSRARDRARGTAAARGYGRAWQRIRFEHLVDEPRCRRCGAPATEVDHIVARRDGGSDEAPNLRSLCGTCHRRRTALDQSGWGADHA